jgi:hypothetical protein
MNFAPVLIFGFKLAKAALLGANTVEAMSGDTKGATKRDLALRVAQDALSFCSENQQIPMTPKIREKWEAYNDAYVALQNAIAEASGGPT